MRTTLLVGTEERDYSASVVRELLGSGTFFFLEAEVQAQDDELSLLLGDVLQLHPLAVEDAEQFSQRPKYDAYETFSYMVVHGARPDKTGTEEMHLIFSSGFVIALHRGTSASMQRVRTRLTQHPLASTAAPQNVLVYLIVDELVDSFFPVLSEFDDTIDSLENDILRRPTEEQLGQLFVMKRQLLGIRKVVTPQRDMFASLSSGVIVLPGAGPEAGNYFRDLYDHLIRISDLVDSYRDLLSGAMDTHISTVSNRLNVVMKQLAIIATVFLPLTFLTGFFGQNFSFLVGHIYGRWPFFVYGIGLEVVAVVIMAIVFKRRGWLGGPEN